MVFPKVSIVIPIYNAEISIETCLKCLINQTYKNIEIICIDDGSEDDSYKIVENYTAKDSRIILMKQKNNGVASARNAGIRLATGDYMMSCDSDDYFEWNAVELCVMACITHDYCDAVYFNAKMFTKEKSFTALVGEEYNCIPADIKCAESNFLGTFTNVCFAMFSLQVIRENGLTFVENHIYEDWDFAIHFNSVARKIYWLNRNLYNYRWAQDSSISGDVTFNCLDIFRTITHSTNYLKTAGRWENNQYSFYIKALGHILYFRRDRLTKAKEDVREAFDEKAKEFVRGIPYTMLCSLVRFFPMEDRVSILKLHPDHGIEVQFCLVNLKRQKIAARKAKIRSFLKRILMKFFPAYRVAVNTRYEMEQMHGELMGKLNEITWLQYENRKEINLIMRKLGIDGEAKTIEEILVAKENENYIK